MQNLSQGGSKRSQKIKPKSAIGGFFKTNQEIQAAYYSPKPKKAKERVKEQNGQEMHPHSGNVYHQDLNPQVGQYMKQI